MVKEYKQKRKKFIEDFNSKLHKFKSNLPNININKIKAVKTTNNLKINTKFPIEVINCQKIKMFLTNTQKLILNKWFTLYTDMYNKTLNYIHNNCGTFKNEVVRRKLKDINKNLYINSIHIRTKLKIIRDEIINSSQLAEIKTNTKIHIQTHTLDYAIRQLVSNIKSAMTNLSNRYIKRFRIKF